MAIFQNDITEAGRALHSHVQVGAVFTPTRIVLGSGYIPSGKTAKTMTDVVAVVINLDIIKKERFNDGKAIFGGVYSNQDITENWYFRELALYAKAVYADGTEVPECLYSYGNAGDTADLMPAYSTGQPVERQMDIITWVGADAAIDLTIAANAPVLREQMGAPNGVATLGADGLVPISQIPTPLALGARSNAIKYVNADVHSLTVANEYIMAAESEGATAQANAALNLPAASGFFSVSLYSTLNRNGENGRLWVARNRNSGGMWVKTEVNGNFSGWAQIYTTANKPTAADIGALPSAGGVLTGNLGIDTGNPHNMSFLPSVEGGRIRITEKASGGYEDFILADNRLVYAQYNAAHQLISSFTVASTEYVDNAAPGLVPASVG